MPEARVPRSLRRAQELFVASNSVRLLINGREAFPEMLGAINAAKHSVLLEMYWFDSDRVGRTFDAAPGRRSVFQTQRQRLGHVVNT